jgi:hypothetical protein
VSRRKEEQRRDGDRDEFLEPWRHLPCSTQLAKADGAASEDEGEKHSRRHGRPGKVGAAARR